MQTAIAKLAIAMMALGLTGSAATVMGADDEDHALNCYIASRIGGMQLQKDGDSRAQIYLDESAYWQPKMGRYGRTEGLGEFETAVNTMAQDKYLYEMLDISDACRWEREGANQAEIDQRLKDKVAAEQARLGQKRAEADAQQAQQQFETDQKCVRIIENASDSATKKYRTAGEEVKMWVATRQYGQNYGYQTLQEGCEILDSAWNQINNMQCSQEVYSTFQNLYNNYAMTLPSGTVMRCTR